MVQNLRSRLSQAAAYPGLGVYTRIIIKLSYDPRSYERNMIHFIYHFIADSYK